MEGAQFVPSEKDLLALSTQGMNAHRLTHILSRSSDYVEGLSWQFSDGSISPPKGTYKYSMDNSVDIRYNDPVCIEFIVEFYSE